MSLQVQQYRLHGTPAKAFELLQYGEQFSSEPPAPDHDPYLLVLLADQELGDGRKDQAITLIEAAFSAFDQSNERGDTDYPG